MPKVFVVNKGCHNYENALRFGEVEYLSEGSVNPYSTGSIYRNFWLKLKNSQPGDYILITGLSIMSSIACGIFARLHGKLNLLIYKAMRGGGGDYVGRTIIIDEKEVIEN